MLPIFYTYLWLREDGTPYYVGKGTRDRAFIRHRIGNAPPKERILIEPHTSEADAFESEKFLIFYYGREDLGLGCLLNRTDGGDGISNISEETRARMRAAKVGKPSFWLGKKRGPLSPEWKAKIGAAARGPHKKGWKHTSEWKAAASTRNKGKILSAEHREKMRISAVARGISPETLEKMAATRKRNFAARQEAK